MEIAFAVSGILALLGGGAGLVAYYRANSPGGSNTPLGKVAGSLFGPETLAGALGVGGGSSPTPTGPPVSIPSPYPTNLGRSSVVVPPAGAPVDTGTAAPAPSKMKPLANVAGTIFGNKNVDTSTNAPAVIA